VDTLRADVLACYGGEPDVGRAICSLGDEGLRFRWALSTSSYTAPSTASLLTGQYPFDHGVRQRAGSSLRESALTVAELLREAGYVTGAVVSNPVLSLPGFDQGFDHYDHEMTRRELNRDVSEREAPATTDAALAWLDAHPEGPWFLWVHYQDPHGPYDPPGRESVTDPPDGLRLSVLGNELGFGGIPSYQALPGLFTREAYTRLYRDEVRYLDAHVARLLDAVDARPRRPAIVLTADHGEALGEQGFYFAHGHSVTLDQVRVPLFYRPADPDRDPGKVVDAPVSLVDVAPLLVDLAGVDAPDSFAGEDVLAEAGPRKGALFAESRRDVAVVDGRRYLVRPRRAPARGDGAVAGRVASLLDGDALPDYAFAQGANDAGALDTLAREYLEHAREAAAPPEDREVSEERRRQLRALGYVE
jgi:arylsulfatase